jgi:hypothetical protein
MSGVQKCADMEEMNKLPYGFHIEPDGKFVRYIGSEDDSCCIVSYYMPIERHNELIRLSRKGTSYADRRHEELTPLQKQQQELLDKMQVLQQQITELDNKLHLLQKEICSTEGHRFEVDTYRADRYRVGVNAKCVDCGYEPFSGDDDDYDHYSDEDQGGDISYERVVAEREARVKKLNNKKKIQEAFRKEVDARMARDKPLIRDLADKILYSDSE